MARQVLQVLAAQIEQLEAAAAAIERDDGDIERHLTALARSPNGCVVVTSSPEAPRHRHLIITLADRYGLRAIYS
jgi:hypothetical protein